MFLLDGIDVITKLFFPAIYRTYTDMLFDEYLAQGDEERRRGFKISPYMDRNDTDKVKWAMNFVDFIGVPLFAALAKAFPSLAFTVDNMKENRDFWAMQRRASVQVYFA